MRPDYESAKEVYLGSDAGSRTAWFDGNVKGSDLLNDGAVFKFVSST